MEKTSPIHELSSEQDLQDWFLLDDLEPGETPGQVEVDAVTVADEGSLQTTTQYLNTPQKINAWDPRLIIDLNLGLDPLEDILTRYDLTPAQLETLNDNPVFRKDLNITAREMREGGISFSRKAATQAESYLEVLDEIVTNPLTPASTRLAGINNVVKWGNLEPKDVKDTGAAGGATVNVQINF